MSWVFIDIVKLRAKIFLTTTSIKAIPMSHLNVISKGLKAGMVAFKTIYGDHLRAAALEEVVKDRYLPVLLAHKA